MSVRGGGGQGEIPAISHYPVETKREQFNNNKDKHYEIKKSWPEARQYDTIPETRSASDLRTCPIEILHDGSRQTLCGHQSQKPFAKRVGNNTFLEIPASRTSFGASYRKCGLAPGSIFRPRARASRGSAQSPRSLEFVKVISLSGCSQIWFIHYWITPKL
jgi:hypothetical protein